MDIFENMNIVQKNKKLGSELADMRNKFELAKEIIAFYSDETKYKENFNYKTGRKERSILNDNGHKARCFLKLVNRK